MLNKTTAVGNAKYVYILYDTYVHLILKHKKEATEKKRALTELGMKLPKAASIPTVLASAP